MNIFVNIFFFSYISLLKAVLSSEIYLVVQGSGTKSLLYQNFYTEPTEVYVNGNKRDNCKKTCELTDDLNNITLIFNQEINSCKKMFYGLYDIIEIDLSNFDSSKVTSMKSMFRYCEYLKKINFGNMVTSSVQDMSNQFEFCYKLEYIDVSNFDTSSVTNMNYMFSDCHQIKTIDLSNFDTKNVVEMHGIISYNDKLISANLSNFDTSKVTNMRALFYKCNNLIYLDLPNFKASSVMTDLTNGFSSLSSLKYLNLRSFKISSSVTLDNTFKSHSSNTKYCIEDSSTRALLNVNTNDCSNICFRDNIIFDMDDYVCVESCDENKFLLKRECYSNCPANTYKILKDRNRCEKIIPENYFKDNDNIYKKCYNLCQKCSQSGDETNNNCDKCINNYFFYKQNIHF